MLLWNSTVTGNCYKVRLLLAKPGIPHERRELSVVDRSNRAGLLGGNNPAQRVPTLEFDDGRCLAESNSILWYLGDGTPYVRLTPSTVLQWQFYEQYCHEPSIAVVRFLLAYSGESERHASEIEEKRRGGYEALTAMEAHLSSRTYFVGDAYSIADISLCAYTHVAGEGGFDLDGYPAVRAWLGRVADQLGHVPIDDSGGSG